MIIFIERLIRKKIRIGGFDMNFRGKLGIFGAILCMSTFFVYSACIALGTSIGLASVVSIVVGCFGIIFIIPDAIFMFVGKKFKFRKEQEVDDND